MVDSLIGQRFGRLVFLERIPYERGKPKGMARFSCDCGNIIVTRIRSVRSGSAKSCGCYGGVNATDRTRHGLHKTKTYTTWAGIKQRCHNPKNPDYPRYGGRSIEVCQRWRDSFLAFLEDMGEAPEPTSSIDRIDNERGYEPANCRWVTRKQQARNRRNHQMLTVNGETRCLSEWAEVTGVHRATIMYRFQQGFAPEDVIARVDNRHNKRNGMA